MDGRMAASGLKWAILLLALAVGAKIAESFLIYSAQASGLSGVAAYREKLEVARTGQLVTVSVFIGLQIIGGLILKAVVRSLKPQAMEKRSLVPFVCAYLAMSMLTIAISAVVQMSRR